MLERRWSSGNKPSWNLRLVQLKSRCFRDIGTWLTISDHIIIFLWYRALFLFCFVCFVLFLFFPFIHYFLQYHQQYYFRKFDSEEYLKDTLYTISDIFNSYFLDVQHFMQDQQFRDIIEATCNINCNIDWLVLYVKS